jgi:hypothetical protein
MATASQILSLAHLARADIAQRPGIRAQAIPPVLRSFRWHLTMVSTHLTWLIPYGL